MKNTQLSGGQRQRARNVHDSEPVGYVWHSQLSRDEFDRLKVTELMSIRSWLLGGIVGSLVGLMVAVGMTFVDWRLNPAGIFHSEEGTDWNIVVETAFSWFWPVALIVLVLTVIMHSWISRERKS